MKNASVATTCPFWMKHSTKKTLLILGVRVVIKSSKDVALAALTAHLAINV